MALFKPVSALERGLAVLSTVSKLGRVRVGDVCQETGLDKATIIRMLETLVHAGYIQKYPADATYTITGRTVGLGRGFGPHSRLSELLGPLILEFRSAIGWPADFGVPDGDAIFLIEAKGGERMPLLWQRPLDYRPDLLLTSLGLIYVAFACEDEQQRLLARIADTPHPEARKLLEDPALIGRTLAKVRRAGCAFGNKSYGKRVFGSSLWGMAVPVHDEQRIYGAVNILVVRSAMNEEEGAKKYLGQLQAFARQVMDAIDNEKAAFPSAPLYKD